MITGERIQAMCSSKWDSRTKVPWNNPSKIFCYGDRLREFRKIQPYIQNPYTLYTHNSDENITDQYTDIANHRLLTCWYAQNLLVHHPKVKPLPIGIANSMWPHGDLSAFSRVTLQNTKTQSFYFYFSLHTNVRDRILCYIILRSKGLPFGHVAPTYTAYLQNLSSYKYAICPPGNGVDSHRIWEALYLGVIPIVQRSVFTEKIAKRVPCILLNTWEEFDATRLLESYSPPDESTYKDFLNISMF